MTDKPYIYSLSLLKLVAVMGILGCHTGLIDTFDACGRMVEILFLSSGFLMAYNHHAQQQPQTGWQVVKSKLPRFYPIHVICFLLQWLFVATWTAKPLSFLLSVGVLNLALQQAWFVRTEFSYNNVSWFLSALVYAYAMTPTIKRAVIWGEKVPFGLLKVFLTLVILRGYCEYLSANASRYVAFDMHCNPFVQMLNYALGYITAVAAIKQNAFNKLLKTGISAWQLTVIQILFITVYMLAGYKLADMERAFFVILALPIFYVLSFDRGIINRLGRLKPVVWLSSMTLEIFMFHSFILYHLPTIPERRLSYVIFFAVTLVVSVSYHLCYQKIRAVWHQKKDK